MTSQTQATKSETNRRHVVAVTQLILITFVYVVSFVPLTLDMNDVGTISLLAYAYYINHVSNFYIYLAVNKEFRKEAQNLVNIILAKVRVRPRDSQPLCVVAPGNAAVAQH